MQHTHPLSGQVSGGADGEAALRQALKRIVRALAEHPAENPLEASLLEELRSFGPLPVPTGPAGNDVNVQARIARLNQALAVMPVVAGVGSLDAEWAEVLGTEIRDLVVRLDTHAAQAVEAAPEETATSDEEPAAPTSEEPAACDLDRGTGDEASDAAPPGAMSPSDLKPAPMPGATAAERSAPIEAPATDAEPKDEVPVETAETIDEPVPAQEEAPSSEAKGPSGSESTAEIGDKDNSPDGVGEPESPPAEELDAGAEGKPSAPFSGPIPAILRREPEPDSASGQSSQSSPSGESGEGIAIPPPTGRPLPPLPMGRRRFRWPFAALMLLLVVGAIALGAAIFDRIAPRTGSDDPVATAPAPVPPTKVTARAEPNPPPEEAGTPASDPAQAPPETGQPADPAPSESVEAPALMNSPSEPQTLPPEIAPRPAPERPPAETPTAETPIGRSADASANTAGTGAAGHGKPAIERRICGSDRLLQKRRTRGPGLDRVSRRKPHRGPRPALRDRTCRSWPSRHLFQAQGRPLR